MENNKISSNIKIAKIILLIANISAAILFFVAYTLIPVSWFLVAGFVMIGLAVLIVFLIDIFEKKLLNYTKEPK